MDTKVLRGCNDFHIEQVRGLTLSSGPKQKENILKHIEDLLGVGTIGVMRKLNSIEGSRTFEF